MAVTMEKLMSFGESVITLKSFPLFCLYLLLIMSAGLWQRVTKPLNLRPLLIGYNFLCSSISLYTFIGFVQGLHQSQHIFQKEGVDYLRPYFYMYWITKIVELIDTVFMVLRHRQRQISFLHVYHHSSMLLLSDYAYHYTPWPAISLFLGINSVVHVLLYFYYGVTAWNPSHTPGWKQRLTEVQIIQFLIDFIFATYGYVHHGYCVYGIFYGLLMTGLFCNFYYLAYIKRKPAKKVE